MCHDQRNYTAATIGEMQRIALIVELKRRIEAQMPRPGVPSRYDIGYMCALNRVNGWLNELCPPCDDPEAPATLADFTEGMRP